VPIKTEIVSVETFNNEINLYNIGIYRHFNDNLTKIMLIYMMRRFKTTTVIIHVAAWLLFLSFPTLFMLQGNKLGISTAVSHPWSFFQFTILFIFVFYFHADHLFPKYYISKRYFIYSLYCIALLLLVLTIRPFYQLNRQLKPFPKPGTNLEHRARIEPRPMPSMHFDMMSMFIFVTLMGMGTSLRSIKEWQRTEKRAILAEAGHANATLSFLKAQINPHFLYNTLNNIYTLCINDHRDAAESIMKLSNIMRYVTDEAESTYVPLQHEISCINNFIDLQRLRLGKKTRLHFKVSGDPAGHRISPLILMTFIENVFKYGLSNHQEANISITIIIMAKKLVFKTENSVFPSQKKPNRTGLGISNTKKRLELLYQGKYELTIQNQIEKFTVDLVLYS
jgi:two-component system LytT family sensor kinase